MGDPVYPTHSILLTPLQSHSQIYSRCLRATHSCSEQLIGVRWGQRGAESPDARTDGSRMRGGHVLDNLRAHDPVRDQDKPDSRRVWGLGWGKGWGD